MENDSANTMRLDAIDAAAAPPRSKPSNYPPLFVARMEGRVKRPLGDLFGLKNFGVNLTTLPPGASSALHHRHSRQDEFIYVLAGCPTLFTDAGPVQLRPGMCAGFPAKGTAHHLRNDGPGDALILEVGDRSPDDTVAYPDDDLVGARKSDGTWAFEHKDGTMY